MLTHSQIDIHTDHQAVEATKVAAVSPSATRTYPQEFVPDFVDIGSYIDDKMRPPPSTGHRTTKLHGPRGHKGQGRAQGHQGGVSSLRRTGFAAFAIRSHYSPYSILRGRYILSASGDIPPYPRIRALKSCQKNAPLTGVTVIIRVQREDDKGDDNVGTRLRLPVSVIVVNDGSTDATEDAIADFT